VRRSDDPDQWRQAVNSDQPIVTQLSEGGWPTSSSSKPSIMADMLDALDVQPGDRVLEIGTGTGWNAALLGHRVGSEGRVVSVEVDPTIAERAARVLDHAGYSVTALTGDGELGCPAGAPYDRVVSTAAVREVVPWAWLDQLRPGGRLVTPWGTDWLNGVMLTLTCRGRRDGSGRFSGDLAFMRIRAQHASLYGWEPSDIKIAGTDVSTTGLRGSALGEMLNPAEGAFAIGALVPDCYRQVDWDHFGRRHHLLDLDDGRTKSFARLEWNVGDPAPFTVRQLGPRRLWDEVVAARTWWHECGQPALDRFGLEIRDDRQWLWLDTPDNVVRSLRIA
jgi:protein-L-isoaspartate O-methyltransferase